MQKFGCSRTKTTSILNYHASEIIGEITAVSRMGSFSLATNGSNDKGPETLYPLVMRYFDNETGRIMCVLLFLCANKKSSMGANIFGTLDDALVKYNIL